MTAGAGHTLHSSAILPSLFCQACNVLVSPVLGPGTGPHVARANCGQCGQFLKWLPKALVLGAQKETRVVASVNRVVLLGEIGKYGVEVRYANNGTACASFMVVVHETGQDGKQYHVLVPCECWGRHAEQAGELEASQLVVFEGRLKKRQKGEQWELIVSGFEVTPVQAPAPAMTGRTN